MMGMSAVFGICLLLIFLRRLFVCTLRGLSTGLSEWRSSHRNLKEEISLYFISKVQVGLPRLAEEFSNIV